MQTKLLLSLGIIFGLSTLTNSKQVCEAGWVPYEDHCYYFSKATRTFKDAVPSCYGVSSALVEPSTIAEERWVLLQSVVRGIKNIWIGVTDLHENDNFVYISNGNSVQEAYNHWDKGQPDKNTEHCVSLVAGYKGWHDYPCGDKFHFVCKKPKN
ncbi:collectin-12-like [Saccostrea cucullata]|uniref:collectin-12-like n=1 Tax=Saccostrea cuccullata TaxID=36930 RepID=UPI002ED0040C